MARTGPAALDVFETPLAGANLVEASAGTGKTWTIAGLYVRLVVERDMPVRQILVVTYTEAATAELRDRIRARLAEVREVLGRGETDDPFCQECLRRYTDRAAADDRLTRALTGFDEAAIHTIHGFCQRALSEHAFESAMPFETEILPDEGDLLQEVVDDFWRRELYGSATPLLRYVLAQGMSPEALKREIAPHVGKAYLTIEGPTSPAAPASEWEHLGSAYRKARALWLGRREEILSRLAQHPNGMSYQQRHMPKRASAMDEYFRSEEPSWALPGEAKWFAVSTVVEKAKGKPYPQHEFFDLCEELGKACDEYVRAAERALGVLRGRLIVYARRELARRKSRLRVQSYDDLLNNLDRALTAPLGSSLADALRTRYVAALIDEFQDTDPIQYGIFARIYQGSDAPVFFVGDPKQAIYSFRGADVFAYLKARQEATRGYTLSTNWRSIPELITAVNTLYREHRAPFLFDAIPFHEAVAAERRQEPFVIEGDTGEPLRFWLVEADGEKPIAKGAAGERVAAATASEIVRLLNLGQQGRARIGVWNLAGGDIAVLVRSHYQASVVKRELRKRGVASVEYSRDNVFESREALELERVLMAVAEPGREPLVRAALATEMLGFDAGQIHDVSENQTRWQERLEAFHAYHELWREHGFIRMHRELLSREEVAPRLLAYPDGERRLTNLNHLGELLQRRSVEERGGMEGLILWLAERRKDGRAGEESVLRLESDEHLVKIVTVHRSKGLEYPIVFCPYLWDGAIRANDAATIVSYHDPEREDQAVLDLGTERQGAAVALARREELAENLRLAYVALTRAQYRCYVVWGWINDGGTSALGWLLHGRDLDASGGVIDALTARFASIGEGGVREAVEALANRSSGTIRVSRLPPPSTERFGARGEEQVELAARPFSGNSAADWWISSFSALARQAAPELPDHDALREREPRREMPDDFSIFAFPRGTRAGSCLHAIFEQLDFASADHSEMDALVAQTLREYGFANVWLPAVAGMVRDVLATPLDASGSLRLCGVTAAQRINEMEFHYPVAELDARKLRQLLTSHALGESSAAREAIESLSFQNERGFMKGFIDLVFEAGGRFYILDYKSNWLGNTPGDYGAQTLAGVMAEEGYYLQYLLYTVAVHRYLGLRLSGYDYERHFGGVYYLFLRGMRPKLGASCGVFHDRPSAAVIQALDAYLAGNPPRRKP